MATELEIVLLDGSGSDSSGDVPTGAQAVGVQGAPAVTQSQQAELHPDAPRGEDFRDLKSSIADLAKRIRGISAQPGTRDRPARQRREEPTAEPKRGRFDFLGPQTEAQRERHERQQTPRTAADAEAFEQSIATRAALEPGTAPETPREKNVVDEANRAAQDSAREARIKAREERDTQTPEPEVTTAREESFDDAASRILGGLREKLGGVKATAKDESFDDAADRILGGLRKRLSGGAVAGSSAVASGARGAAGAAGGAVAGSSAGASALAIATGPIGISVAAVVGSLALLTAGVRTAAGVFAGLADDLEEYSGPVAAVRARAEVGRELRRVDRAREIGPQVAQVAAAQAEFNSAIADLKESLIDELVKYTPLIETGLELGTAAVTLLTNLKELVDVIQAANPVMNLLLEMDLNTEIEQLKKANVKSALAIIDVLTEDADAGRGVIDEDLIKLFGIRGRPQAVPPNEAP